jgi:hypothetical protein
MAGYVTIVIWMSMLYTILLSYFTNVTRPIIHCLFFFFKQWLIQRLINGAIPTKWDKNVIFIISPIPSSHPYLTRLIWRCLSAIIKKRWFDGHCHIISSFIWMSNVIHHIFISFYWYNTADQYVICLVNVLTYYFVRGPDFEFKIVL